MITTTGFQDLLMQPYVYLMLGYNKTKAQIWSSILHTYTYSSKTQTNQ